MSRASRLCTETGTRAGLWQLILHSLPQSLSHDVVSQIVTMLLAAYEVLVSLFCFAIRTNGTTGID
jgi:hypothetical protein